MPIRSCPTCQNATYCLLEGSSRDAFVNYYRCYGCGCVWTIHKDEPNGPPNVVANGRTGSQT